MTKKEIGVTDPFKFSPCEFNDIIYACRQPFVDIVRGKLHTLPENKFAGGKMRADALDLVIAESGEPYVFVERMFGRSEPNLRPAHVLALMIPGWFAKPTVEEWRKFTKNQTRWTKHSLKAFMKTAAGADIVPRADNQGLVLERHVETLEREDDEIGTLSPSSDEDNSGLHEGHVQDVLLFTNNTADCKSFMARKQVQTTLSPDPKMLVLAAGCRDEGECTAEGLFQAAGRADAGLIRNVVNGHGNPVDLLCLGQTIWYHGMLVVEGLVDVTRSTKTGENEISHRAYEKYMETCVTTKAKKVLSHAELNKKLDNGVETLRDWNKEIEYLPARMYVVGKLYLPSSDTDSLELPTSLKIDKLFHGDARIFTEGLLRAVIGDAVLQWTPQRACAAKLIRLAILRDAVEQGGVPPGLASANRKFDWYLEASMPLDAKKLQLKKVVAELRACLGSDELEKLLQAEIMELTGAGSLEQTSATGRLEIQETTSVEALEQREGSDTPGSEEHRPPAEPVSGEVKQAKPVTRGEVKQVKIERRPLTKRKNTAAAASSNKVCKKSLGSPSARDA